MRGTFSIVILLSTLLAGCTGGIDEPCNRDGTCNNGLVCVPYWANTHRCKPAKDSE